MNWFVFTLALLLIAAGFVLFISKAALRLPASTERTVLVVVAVLGILLFDGLLIGTALLPGKVNSIITDGVAYIEAEAERTQPGYTSEEMSAEGLLQFISQTKSMKQVLYDNPEAGMMVRFVGLSTYVNLLTGFADGAEEHLRHFEETGTPMTMHNILVYAQDVVHQKVIATAQTLQWVLVVLAVLALAILMFACWQLKKEGVGTQGGVVFGENVRKEEQQ